MSEAAEEQTTRGEGERLETDEEVLEAAADLFEAAGIAAGEGEVMGEVVPEVEVKESVADIKQVLDEELATPGELRTLAGLIASSGFLPEAMRIQKAAESEETVDYIVWLVAAGIGAKLLLVGKKKASELIDGLKQKKLLRGLKKEGGLVEVEERDEEELEPESEEKQEQLPEAVEPVRDMKKGKRKPTAKGAWAAVMRRRGCITGFLVGSLVAYGLGSLAVKGVKEWAESEQSRQALEELREGWGELEEAAEAGFEGGVTEQAWVESEEFKNIESIYKRYSVPSWDGLGVSRAETYLVNGNINDELVWGLGAYKGASWFFGVFEKDGQTVPNEHLVSLWASAWELTEAEKEELRNNWLTYANDKDEALKYLEWLNSQKVKTGEVEIGKLGEEGDMVVNFYTKANELFNSYPGEGSQEWEQRVRELEDMIGMDGLNQLVKAGSSLFKFNPGMMLGVAMVWAYENPDVLEGFQVAWGEAKEKGKARDKRKAEAGAYEWALKFPRFGPWKAKFNLRKLVGARKEAVVTLGSVERLPEIRRLVEFLGPGWFKIIQPGHPDYLTVRRWLRARSDEEYQKLLEQPEMIWQHLKKIYPDKEMMWSLYQIKGAGRFRRGATDYEREWLLRWEKELVVGD